MCQQTGSSAAVPQNALGTCAASTGHSELNAVLLPPVPTACLVLLVQLSKDAEVQLLPLPHRAGSSQMLPTCDTHS